MAGNTIGKGKKMDREEIKEKYRHLCKVERTFLAEVYEVCNNLNPDIF